MPSVRRKLSCKLHLKVTLDKLHFRHHEAKDYNHFGGGQTAKNCGVSMSFVLASMTKVKFQDRGRGCC